MRSAVIFAVLTWALAALPGFAQSPTLQTAAGYAYTFADQGDGHSSMSGWWVNSSYTLKGPLQLSAETDNYYGTFRGQSLNQHSFTAGPQLSFNSSGKFSPFLQALIGGSRSSSPGNISWGFTSQFGAGAQVQIAPRVSLYLQPLEYDLTADNGALHSYSAKAGLSFTLVQKSK